MKSIELEKSLEAWQADCYCKQDGTDFCGLCECGREGHTQSMPLMKKSGWCELGEWCDDCAKRIIRMDHAGKAPEEIMAILATVNPKNILIKMLKTKKLYDQEVKNALILWITQEQKISDSHENLNEGRLQFILNLAHLYREANQKKAAKESFKNARELAYQAKMNIIYKSIDQYIK